MKITSYPFFIAILFASLWITACKAAYDEQPVRVGAEVLLDKHLAELKSKRLGLAMNPTARVGNTHMLDTLMALGLDVTTLFAAEHGFRGEASDGEVIRDGRENKYNLPVYSLYGQTKKPTQTMLEQVDVILFDMQDVGARFYTFYQTLFRILESADQFGKEVWVLDRPNPAGGLYFDGWIMEEEYHSFVGAQPIPIAHGLTIGELARMAIGEGWIQVKNAKVLRVIQMENWDREMTWKQTGLEWYPPSPNLPSEKHAYLYLGTALFEGSNISEGRGTENPFLQIGSANIQFDVAELDTIMKNHGVSYELITDRPVEIEGKAVNPKFEGQDIPMLNILDFDINKCKPVDLGIDLLNYFARHDSTFQTRAYLNNLAGTDLRAMLEEGTIRKVSASELDDFAKARSTYLIY
jgi:uncharacterized protein YbbC (DUF1343 family)